MADPVRETPKAHAAFEAYWALGDGRSIQKLSQQLAKSVPLLKQWSSRYHWQARVIARQDQLAAEQERVRRESREAAVAAHDKRLVEIGEEGEALAVEVLKARARAGQMGAVAAVQFLALSAKLALRGYREPETIIRNEHTGADGGPIEATDPRDTLARRLDELAASLRAGGVAGEPDATGTGGAPA